MLVQWSEYCAAVSFMFLILYSLAALKRSKLQCLNCARMFVCETGKRTSVSHPERRRTHKRTLCVHFGILKCVPYVCWMLCVHGAEVSIALATARVFVLLLQHTYTHAHTPTHNCSPHLRAHKSPESCSFHQIIFPQPRCKTRCLCWVSVRELYYNISIVCVCGN